MTIARYASSGAQPLSRSAWLSRPHRGHPVAVATYPARLYQAKVGVRRLSGMVWLRPACSIARNGPTSLPVGEMTPMAPARISSGTQLVNAKAMPATIISADPTMRVRRRPNRSALVVSQSEMIVSPMSVSVRTMPIASGSSPAAAR